MRVTFLLFLARRYLDRMSRWLLWMALWDATTIGVSSNIDATQEAVRFGIDADRAVNYKCDEAGTSLNYHVIGEAVCSVRADRPLSADWKRRIDEDVQKRGR